MPLSTQNAKLYYKLWFLLLDFVNKKYRIKDIREMEGAKGLNPNEVKEIADKLWEDVSVIDEYLTACGDDMHKENRAILESWKRRIRGEFILERHLKKGSVFISMDDKKVYLVSGITSGWEEIFWYTPTPIMMKATLMPFKDMIISDGLVTPYNTVFGSSTAGQLEQIYLAAKRNGRLHRSL